MPFAGGCGSLATIMKFRKRRGAGSKGVGQVSIVMAALAAYAKAAAGERV
jgi:hypothetical protein